MVVEERHERFEHVGAHVFMELSREGHLRAWLLEEVDSRLTQRSESTLNWAEDFAQRTTEISGRTGHLPGGCVYSATDWTHTFHFLVTARVPQLNIATTFDHCQ